MLSLSTGPRLHCVGIVREGDVYVSVVLSAQLWELTDVAVAKVANDGTKEGISGFTRAVT